MNKRDRPKAGDSRLHHLNGPVLVLRAEGPHVQVVNSETSAVFWTYDTCLWRAAK